MFHKFFILTQVLLFSVFLLPATSIAKDAKAKPIIDLSPNLMSLLRAEMAELSGGIQGIPLAIAAADWHAIEEISEKMHQSYIMKSSLTKLQAVELKEKLPDSFKLLDAAFHAKAKQLGEAAATKDSDLVVFRFSRVIEACAGCHAKFSTNRFPGFMNESEGQHKH